VSPREKSKVFEKISLPLLDSLYSYALALVGEEEEAKDLVQETYLKAFRAFDSFQEGTNIKAWLFRILKNTFINQFHYKKRFEELQGELTEEGTYEKLVARGKIPLGDHGGGLYEESLGDEVQEALSTLPEDFRSAVYLADVENMSYQEIARVMNCPIGTVRSRIARGRRMLQGKLIEYALKQGIVKRGS